MKVLFYVRANHDKVKGGDLMQLYKTGEAVSKEGIKVEYSSDQNKNLNGYDVVHIFNSPRFEETERFFANAKKYNKPIAFSTIYWSKDELAVGVAKNRSVDFIYQNFGIEVAKRYRKIAKSIQNIGRKDSSVKIEKWLFEKADILLPNSKGEMIEIEKSYRIKNNFVVVRNAVDSGLFLKQPSGDRENYVLSVGRIERRKNTLKLIEACNQLSLNLTLIGGYDTNDEYALECLDKIKAYGQTHIHNIEQKELANYYYKAKVHAIVSWYETPGLASLEAACGGCSIVSTDRGSTKEYFGTDATYCNPFSLESIVKAISLAMAKPPKPALRKKIISQYNWEGAASDTIKGYNQIK
jgi:glycosyltransferase involved in cell wall biosynthesis